MLQSPMEFFRTLPAKKCSECGKEIDEQAEAYHNHCEDCNPKES